MSRSRSRLAADWFAKLRVNAVTNEVENTDITSVGDSLSTVASSGSYNDLTDIPDVSASSLSSNFTVAAGKTVSAGTVANLYGGEIGTNPVANTLGTEQSYSAETFNHITGDGNTIVKAYSNGSGHHCVKTISTATGSVVSDVAVYTGYTACGTSIKQISDNRFLVYGGRRGGSTVVNYCGYNTHQYPNEDYFVMVEVASNGSVTYGSAYTSSYTQKNANQSISLYTLEGSGRAGFYRYRTCNYCNCSAMGTTQYYRDYYTFPITGSLNISLQTTDAFITSMDNSIVNTAGNKLVQPSTSTSWNICDWDGVDVSSGTTITNNRTNLTSAQFLKPDPTSDKLLCFYINTNLELCVETLEWTSSSIDVVPNSKWIVEADASGVSLGSIKGSTAGISITYENGSKGRFKSLSLDSNLVVNGSSSLMTTNNSNVVPGLAYKGSDVFQVWHNNVDTYTTSVTVNAYSTSPLKPLGVITENGTGGDSVSVATRGVVSGFTGLTPDAKYYYDTATFDGTVTTTNTGIYVGRAVSTTQIQLTDLTEQ